MIKFPKIELIYEKFERDDFQLYYTLVRDEKVMAMITERAIPLSEAKADYEKILVINDLHSSFGYFKVKTAATKEFVGLAKMEVIAQDSSEAELGYILLPSHWGKGFGNQMATEMLSIARREPQIRKVTAIIDPQNIPSRKILVNNGFVSEEFKDFDGLPGEILSLVF
ncbi:GNAT family N-acetyltransferase [Sphingobacterium spiritivorum]|uniref:GNAT family N-acetyltransferase n=1 Tax=Sphingobacterium spiritivorum TaxID=258 RepID=UPI003DA1CB3B